MNKRFKLLMWFFIILTVIFTAVNVFLGAFAPRMVERQIENNLNLKSRVGKITLSPPLVVSLERIEIGDLVLIKKISFSPNLISLFFGKIVIHGLTVNEPVINIEQSAQGKLNLPELKQKGKAPDIYLTSLRVIDGKIIFTDKKVNPNGLQLILQKLNLKVSKVSLPVTSLAADFDASAELADPKQPIGNIGFRGVLDYPKRDMDAKLEIKDLNLVPLTPYSGNFISDKKLTAGLLNLNSDFKAKNNELSVFSVLNLSQLAYEESQAPAAEAEGSVSEPPRIDFSRDALELFTDQNGNLRLEFQVDTLLDRPSLDPEKVKGIILKAAMKNLSSQSPERLIDKVSETLEKYKDIGEGFKKLFE